MTEDITMLEKLSERQLRLAMLLSMDSFYLEDLAKKIAVTKKTLLSDIAAFNFVHSPASIHIDEHQKVSLRLPCEYNLESITSTILKHSSHIQLLKIILMQEPCIAKLADQLFLSTASIRRIIMFLNESFQKRGFLFRIHTTPYVHIQGEERQIRFFYCSLFEEIYTPDQLPHYQILSAAIKRYMKLYPPLNKLSVHKQLFLIYYFLISIIRIGKKHKLSDQLKSQPLEMDIDLFFERTKNNVTFCSVMEKNYHFYLTKETASELLRPISQMIHFASVKAPAHEIKKLRNLSQNFYRSLSTDTMLSDQQLNYLYHLISFKKEFLPFLTNSFKQFFVIVLNSDPLILSFYEQALVEENYSFILTNRLLYEELLKELVLLSPALIDRIIPKKKTYTVMILSSQEPKVCFLYKELLTKKFPEIKEIKEYQDSFFDLNYRLINQYDLVLTDFPLDRNQLNTKIIKISNFPAYSFWENIEAILHKQ